MLDRIPAGEHVKGEAKITLKDERGFALTKKFGFTVQEESGKVLAFDTFDHPELGTVILFGDQVFALRYWSNDDLAKATNMLTYAFCQEKTRRGIGVYDSKS